MLVPLTDSLYARGTLGATGSVLVDIGTGYYAEVRFAFVVPEAGSGSQPSVHVHHLSITVTYESLDSLFTLLQYTPEGGQEYCKRKVALLQDSLKKIDEARAFNTAANSRAALPLRPSLSGGHIWSIYQSCSLTPYTSFLLSGTRH